MYKEFTIKAGKVFIKNTNNQLSGRNHLSGMREVLNKENEQEYWVTRLINCQKERRHKLDNMEKWKRRSIKLFIFTILALFTLFFTPLSDIMFSSSVANGTNIMIFLSFFATNIGSFGYQQLEKRHISHLSNDITYLEKKVIDIQKQLIELRKNQKRYELYKENNNSKIELCYQFSEEPTLEKPKLLIKQIKKRVL